MKRTYPNAIVFMHVGKFYEVFHSDVDVLIDILERCVYMNGNIAHSGFPVNVADEFTQKLNEAGYSVVKSASV